MKSNVASCALLLLIGAWLAASCSQKEDVLSLSFGAAGASSSEAGNSSSANPEPAENGGELCECEQDELCHDGRCVACLASSDCAEDEACDLASKECRPTCREDGECSYFCGANDYCVECREPEDCSDDLLCAPSGICVKCLTSDECLVPGKLECDTVAGVCVECTLDEHCDQGVCDPINFDCGD